MMFDCLLDSTSDIINQTSDVFRMTSAKIQPQKRVVKCFRIFFSKKMFGKDCFQNVSVFFFQHQFVCIETLRCPVGRVEVGQLVDWSVYFARLLFCKENSIINI